MKHGGTTSLCGPMTPGSGGSPFCTSSSHVQPAWRCSQPCFRLSWFSLPYPY